MAENDLNSSIVSTFINRLNVGTSPRTAKAEQPSVNQHENEYRWKSPANMLDVFTASMAAVACLPKPPVGYTKAAIANLFNGLSCHNPIFIEKIEKYGNRATPFEWAEKRREEAIEDLKKGFHRNFLYKVKQRRQELEMKISEDYWSAKPPARPTRGRDQGFIFKTEPSQ